VPPPSAESTGLGTLPATRTDPTAADLQAGTGLCGGQALPEIEITDPGNGDTVPAGTVNVEGTADPGAQSGAATVKVRATDGDDFDQEVDATSTDGFQTWNASFDFSGQEGDQMTISARLLLDGSQVAVDSIQVTVEAPAHCPGFAGDPRNQVVGTSNDDDLRGTPGPDVICGRGGDDSIRGLGGGDLLIGNGGDDLLIGGDGNDRIRGGTGVDDGRGNGGNDSITSANGNDRLHGGVGNDRLVGQGNADTLIGAGGDDALFGVYHRDTLEGGTGDDDLDGGPGRDTCDGGPGQDSVTACEQP
jgi:Ca2+-binding RTX toxin-like protein